MGFLEARRARSIPRGADQRDHAPPSPRPDITKSADDPGSSDELWDLKEDIKEERPREDLKVEGCRRRHPLALTVIKSLIYCEVRGYYQILGKCPAKHRLIENLCSGSASQPPLICEADRRAWLPLIIPFILFKLAPNADPAFGGAHA
jgi:hypothetical protein